MLQHCTTTYTQPVPSPAPPTPLLPASPATCGIGSPAQQPLMTPEENEAYLRKLNELQRYAPLLNKWIARLSQSQDNRRNDQYVKLKSLYNLLNNEQRRVPLATLMKCEAALVKLSKEQSKENQEASGASGQTQQVSTSAVSTASVAGAPPSSSSSLSSSGQPSTATSFSVSGSTAAAAAASTMATTPSSLSSSLTPHSEPVVPPTKLTDPSKSKSLMDFKMIPSPPPTCGNLLETIQAKPLPPERVPPAKRLCNRGTHTYNIHTHVHNIHMLQIMFIYNKSKCTETKSDPICQVCRQFWRIYPLNILCTYIVLVK